MAKKRVLKYSLRAESRLMEIGRYTQQHWGKKQRGIYLKILMDACEQLCAHPLSRKTRDALFTGIRSIRVGKHVVFYFVQKDRILIVDILHERMEPERYFS